MKVKIEEDSLYPNYIMNGEFTDLGLDLPEEFVNKYEKIYADYLEARRVIKEAVNNQCG